MPVRSSSSSVLVWPKKTEVIRALRVWAEALAQSREDLVHAGYFGSLGRDDWGVGSDADLVVVVRSSNRPPIERPLEFDLSSIQVPADLLVYTSDEWESVVRRRDRFGEEMRNATWLVPSGQQRLR
jgi:uncharacterized protein